MQSVNQTGLAHFRVLVAWIWGGWMIMLFSLHRWCSTRGINLVKHAVSGIWCPVGPPGGRGARGYGEFRRNTLSCGTLQGLSLCTPPSSVANPFSLVTPLLLSRMALWCHDCARSCARLALVFLWAYITKKLFVLLCGVMRGISGIVVHMFWHVMKSRLPLVEFRPHTWQAAREGNMYGYFCKTILK